MPIPSYLPDTPPEAARRREFARRLRRALHEKGWTVEELRRAAVPYARNTYLTRDALWRYLNGAVLPSSVHFAAMCEALGKQPDELLPALGPSIDDRLAGIEARLAEIEARIAELRRDIPVRL